jgi:ubiquinone biosynthesis protein COQ4
MKRLYPTHVPSTFPQKAVLAASSAVLGFIDPSRTQHVARLGETLSCGALGRMREVMRKSEDGRRVLAERPCFKSWADPESLVATCGVDTLGRRYGEFMLREKLDPLSRSDVRFVDDEELAYVMKRYREIHDIWHVLLGFESVTVESEIGLKWAEFAATGLPMNGVAALIGPLRVAPRHWVVLARKVAPWVIQNAKPLSQLIAVYYEKHVQKDLFEFRRELGLADPPVFCHE